VSFAAITRCIASQQVFIVVLFRYRLSPETFGYTLVLTLLCGVLFEKLIFTQLVKKILLSLWNPKVHYRFHKNLPLDTPEPAESCSPHRSLTP
jgi:hypothetical protein